MPKLSSAQRTFLQEATSRYHKTLAGSPAEEYLDDRGLADAAGPFRLGFVADPLPGHEAYAGWLAIPYLRRSVTGWSVVTMRFRCVEDHDHRAHRHGKYMSQAGEPPRLFNTLALQSTADTVALCEGEIDAMSATLSGVPAVGVAGVEAWQLHFALPFLGFDAVHMLADNDRPKYHRDCSKCKPSDCKGHNPGMDFANHMAKQLRNLKIVPSALGEDVNSEMLRHGREYIRSKVLSGARRKENTS